MRISFKQLHDIVYRSLLRESEIMSDEDAAYIEAIKNKDMGTVEKMVLAKARKNKYTIEAFHGTDKKFTVFDNYGYSGRRQIGADKGFFFADSSQHAVKFSKVGNKTYKPNWKELLKGTAFKTPNEYRLFSNAMRPDEYGYWPSRDELKKRLGIETDDEFFVKRDSVFEIQHRQYIAQDEINKQNAPIVMHVFLRNGRWNRVSGELLGVSVERDAYLSSCNANGYDGVKITGADTGGYYGTEYIVFKPENIKLADLITYDDDGDIIPLSKRFDMKNPDIRY